MSPLRHAHFSRSVSTQRADLLTPARSLQQDRQPAASKLAHSARLPSTGAAARSEQICSLRHAHFNRIVNPQRANLLTPPDSPSQVPPVFFLNSAEHLTPLNWHLADSQASAKTEPRTHDVHCHTMVWGRRGKPGPSNGSCCGESTPKLVAVRGKPSGMPRATCQASTTDRCCLTHFAKSLQRNSCIKQFLSGDAFALTRASKKVGLRGSRRSRSPVACTRRSYSEGVH